MTTYDVACFQTHTRVIRRPTAAESDATLEQNLSRFEEVLEATMLRFGSLKLVVLPEYGFQGQFRPRTVQEWLAIAQRVPGPVTERLGALARRHGCHIAAQLLEFDPDWPDRYWNCAFILDPAGKIVLKYRKHNGPNNMATHYTGPADVYSEYARRYGQDAFFPVVDTEIGRLGCLTCGDLFFPEVARCLAMKGAEVLIHLTSEPHLSGIDMDVWQQTKRVRAYENMAYLVSCNVGQYSGSNRPEFFSHGGSLVAGPDGRILAEAPAPGETVLRARLDLRALRELRTELAPHIFNPLYMLRSDLYAPEYARAAVYPNDAFAERLIGGTDDTRAVGRAVIDRQLQRGVLRQG